MCSVFWVLPTTEYLVLIGYGFSTLIDRIFFIVLRYLVPGALAMSFHTYIILAFFFFTELFCCFALVYRFYLTVNYLLTSNEAGLGNCHK